MSRPFAVDDEQGRVDVDGQTDAETEAVEYKQLDVVSPDRLVRCHAIRLPIDLFIPRRPSSAAAVASVDDATTIALIYSGTDDVML